MNATNANQTPISPLNVCFGAVIIYRPSDSKAEVEESMEPINSRIN